jgi:D-psicose/D-tagatose/L-ribulose 3-epimerase
VYFGIHSLLFKETFVDADLPVLDHCKSMGFDAVEIIPFDPDNFPAAKVRQAAADLGLKINTGYGMPEECNTISPDPAVRQAGVELSRKLIDLSAEAGATVFGGAVYCGWGYRSGQMRSDEEWQWGVESMRAIAEYAQMQAPELILGIEPLNRFESHFINIAEDALKFIEAVGMPNVKVHLDTFHMIREENDITGAIEQCGANLGYMHACENQRGIPGTGLVPWLEVFQALKRINYDGCVTIESFDPDMPRIAKLCCIWRKLADSPDQLAVEGLAYLKGIQQQVFAA